MNVTTTTTRFPGIILLLLLFVSLISTGAHSQSIDDIDFENLTSEQLSDGQLRQLMQRAEDRGLSPQQLNDLAVARGMSPTEAAKLQERLRQIRLDGGDGGGGTDTQQVDRQRNVEKGVTPANQSNNQNSNIFGYDLFRQSTKAFAPSLNIPTPENYVLGAKDELIIDIWGGAENTYQLEISPEGTIRIPNLGPVYLNGLTIEEARTKIREQLSKIYAGLKPDSPSEQRVFMQISLGNVRSINVTIIGEISVPGSYTLPSLATVFNALYTAGGPTRRGSFRKIEIIRDNEIVAELDIYDFLVFSDQSDNIRLQDQDVIKIPTFLNRVQLSGQVKQGGLFELKGGETISNLLTYAGGFTAEAYQKTIKIERKTDTELSIKNVDKPQFDTFALKSGDEITVGKILDRYENRVEIRGAVFRPGTYELTDTTTLYSLIQRAEGVKEDVFTNRGLIIREQEDLTTEAIAFNVGNVLSNPSEHDMQLQRNDVVRITSIFTLREELSVTISGSVINGGTFNYLKEMTLEDLIFRANGFRDEAAPYRIEVARRIVEGDPDTYSPRIADLFTFSVDEDLILDEQASDFKLMPFDQVFVRKSPAYEVQRNITINGEVLYPGSYTLESEEDRVSDIIERAGGLTKNAYPAGANLMRRKQDVSQTLNIDEVSDSLQVGGTILERKSGNMQQVALNLPKILANPGSEFDYLLQEADRITIPKQLQTVQISGEVLFPVSVRYKKGKSFGDYISAAGGFAEQADAKRAFVVYANGEVDRTKKFLFIKNRPKLKPGARIVVPQEEVEEELSTRERIAILSIFISTLAVIANVVDNLGN